MQTIVETPDFIRQAKKLRLSDEDLDNIKIIIAQGPDNGDVIPGSGGARKVRIPIAGRGKSGGYRVITFYSGVDLPVFLLDIYAKSKKANLTQAETNRLSNMLVRILKQYKE